MATAAVGDAVRKHRTHHHPDSTATLVIQRPITLASASGRPHNPSRPGGIYRATGQSSVLPTAGGVFMYATMASALLSPM